MVTFPEERETVPSAPAAGLRGRSNDRAAGMATGPTQVSGEVAANAPPAITAETPKSETLAAIEYQTLQAAALPAAATADPKQQTE